MDLLRKCLEILDVRPVYGVWSSATTGIYRIGAVVAIEGDSIDCLLS